MFFDFGFGEQYDVVIDQYVGNALVGSNQLSGPKEILQMQFLSLVQQIGKQRQPMKLIMKRPISFWDDIDQKQKTIWHEIEFKNWRDN